MALSRSELKMLVKEILVEILAEGLGGSLQAPMVSSQPSRLPRPGSLGPVRENRLPGRPRPHDPRLDTPMKEQIKLNSGGNPVMAQILADTARTTLPKLAADRGLGGTSLDEAASASPSAGIQQVEQINGTPEQVFGEDTASRWADLAFAVPKKLV